MDDVPVAHKPCKMHLWPFTIAHACPYHIPSATMSHSAHNIGTSRPRTHMMSAICLVQTKLGFICEESSSPTCQTPWKMSNYPLKSVMMTSCEAKTPERMLSMQENFTVPDSLGSETLFSQKAGWGVPTGPVVVRSVRQTAKFLEMM